VVKGHWCPKCSGVDIKDLNFLQELAAKRQGNCLADTYTNSHTKVRWKCHIKNHKSWMATPNSIQRGKWCPMCGRISSALLNSKNNKGPKKSKAEKLEILRILAKERGGFLVSNKYINNKIPLIWECKKHGRWEASPQDVKNGGTWCPICGREKASKTKKDNLKRKLDKKVN